MRGLVRVIGMVTACAAADASRANATDVFLLTGTPNQARSSHAAALLPDERVLVVGGWVSQLGYFSATASGEVYDPTTEEFTPTADMAQARIGPAAVLLRSGQVLVLGGWGPVPQGSFDSLASAEIFDPATGSFLPTGSMATPRQGMAATLLADGTVLLTGGSSSYNRVSSAEIYDPATGEFSPTGPMSQPRSNHTATLLPTGQVLITSERSAELYDPITRAFTLTGYMSMWRAWETATLLEDGRVLVAGQGGSADVYDPVTGTFSATGTMLTDRSGVSATLLQTGSVLFVGGGNVGGGNPPRMTERYEPSTGTFVPAAALQFGRSGNSATLLRDGRVLVVGGDTSFWEPSLPAELYHAAGHIDTVAPIITVPADITTVAGDASGATVYYDVSATDDVDSYPTVSCTPPSGAVFPVGTTAVACEAIDSSGNTASASFQVTVVPPIDISVTLDGKLAIDSRTRFVTVAGTVTCNRRTYVSLSGRLTQIVAKRAILTGDFYGSVECLAPVTRWSATVAANLGSFGAGSAEASVSAFTCELGCDGDQTSQSVHVGKGR